MVQRVIRVFPDWGHAWPLWEDEGPVYTVTPADLRLSDHLTRELADWMRVWSHNFSPEAGWPDAELRDRWYEQGHSVDALLRDELEPAARIVSEWAAEQQ